MKGAHPDFHKPRKFPSSSLSPKRIYDHAWSIRFLDQFGRQIFALHPYVLHGPSSLDNGFEEIKAMAKKTREDNRFLPIYSVKIAYLGVM